MARYQSGNFGFKTVELHEKKDPIKNLWRNVLITGIEDLLKKKEIQIKFDIKKYSLEEIWINNKDFDLVCEYSQLEPKIVRKRVYESIQKMEKNYGKNKNNMPTLPWKRLYQNDGVDRSTDRNNTTMSTM